MADEYLTLSEFKELRRISDTADDALLQTRLTRASRAIDDRTGRVFYAAPAASLRYFRAGWGGQVLTDDISSLLDLAVTWEGQARTDIRPWPRNALAKGWPIEGLDGIGGGRGTGEDVEVTARWGWPSVPEAIKEATFLLANRRWQRKDSPEGVAGVSTEGPTRVSRFDPDIEDLIGPFVLDGFA